MIKHDFLKILEKLQLWEALKAKKINDNFLIGNALFLTPFMEQKTVFQYHVWFEPQT